MLVTSHGWLKIIRERRLVIGGESNKFHGDIQPDRKELLNSSGMTMKEEVQGCAQRSENWK